MSNETRQKVWEAAGRYHADATSTDELEAALAAHKADEKPKPKPNPKAATKPAGDDLNV